ncbi:MAG TPA: branched-chain amino acid transaminase [Caldilineaceae bacterium]|nr:branched-chain amino acid transaminase [Caldilineaceae bacterium]
MTQYAFFEGQIRPIGEAKVSIMTHTFNYGTGCFGGIRAYWSEAAGQLYVFRLLDHYRRFLNSAKLLMGKLDYSAEELAQITVDLLSREGWHEDAYIRPLFYKADEIIGVRLHNLRDAVAIFSVPMGRYLASEEGLKVCTSSWRRVEDTAIPPRGKIIGSYVNSALIKSEAVLNGFDEALVLNEDGHIAEASAANFVMVRHGKLIVPPACSNALEGITLSSLLYLARHELGLEVVERNIDRTEVYVADEAFFCGTGAQIAAIASLDHRPIGDGRMGPITAELRRRYFRIVRGQEPAYSHWLTPVFQAVPA